MSYPGLSPGHNSALCVVCFVPWHRGPPPGCTGAPAEEYNRERNDAPSVTVARGLQARASFSCNLGGTPSRWRKKIMVFRAPPQARWRFLGIFHNGGSRASPSASPRQVVSVLLDSLASIWRRLSPDSDKRLAGASAQLFTESCSSKTSSNRGGGGGFYSYSMIDPGRLRLSQGGHSSLTRVRAARAE